MSAPANIADLRGSNCQTRKRSFVHLGFRRGPPDRHGAGCGLIAFGVEAEVNELGPVKVFA
jgi:hypothetical protein